jgi:hypothetical protein
VSPTAAGNDQIAQIARRMCGENAEAAEWFLSVLDLSNLWDHITDGDEIDRGASDATLMAVAVGWGLNQFYRQHSAVLSAVSLNAILAWKSSDGSVKLRCKAFDVATEVGTTVAFLVGGPDHAMKWSAELRRWALAKQTENDAKKGN